MDIVDYSDKVWRGLISLEEYRAGQLTKHGLVEVGKNTRFWLSTGNVVAVDTGDGLVLLDTGQQSTAEKLFESIRRWTPTRLCAAVFSHGHLDHIFGMAHFDAESREQRWPSPTVIAHEAILDRFVRYVMTAGYRRIVNQRQFQDSRAVWPTNYRYPDVTYRDKMQLHRGDVGFVLYHARGETDDHTYVWLPGEKILYTADFFIWACPNAGNPQKTQRYPQEWASALRHMATLEPEVLLPGHGVPIFGRQRIQKALADTAELLESLCSQVLELMNQGWRLNDIVHEVRVPEHLTTQPYLYPSHDEPEFLVNSIWRQYGGWYNGNPADLKPAASADLAFCIAELAGGTSKLVERAILLMREGKYRVACHLIEMAALADPSSRDVHDARALVFSTRAELESSTMARGIFGSAAAESRATGSKT